MTLTRNTAMPLNVVLVSSENIDGVEYALYYHRKAVLDMGVVGWDVCGVVRVSDSDSGNVVTVRRFDDFDAAKQTFTKTVEFLNREPTCYDCNASISFGRYCRACGHQHNIEGGER